MVRKGIGKRIKNVAHAAFLDHLSDETYCRLMYRRAIGRPLNLQDPQTYNEKVQWLKLNYRLPIFTTMVDKYAAKDYIRKIVGDEVIIPTIALWESETEIDPALLPDKFVMKCTHDSHTVFVCKDKSTFDFKGAKKIIRKALKKNFYYVGREWPYKNVTPRIIVEEYIEDNANPFLLDYKFYMFDGQFKMLSVTERNERHQVFIDYYDQNKNRIDMTWGYPNTEMPRNLPDSMPYMLELAKKLSKNIPFIRVDMYEVNGNVYIGELTFYDGAGFDEIKPVEWDRMMGEWLDIDKLYRGGITY